MCLMIVGNSMTRQNLLTAVDYSRAAGRSRTSDCSTTIDCLRAFDYSMTAEGSVVDWLVMPYVYQGDHLPHRRRSKQVEEGLRDA